MPSRRVFDREEGTSTADFDSSNPKVGVYWFEDELLEITFWNGRVYQYSGVPKEVWKGLCDAARPGAYFYHHIRRSGYSYEEV